MDNEPIMPSNPGLIQPKQEDIRNVPLSAIDGVPTGTPPPSYFTDISMLDVNSQGLQPSCVAEATSKIKEWQEYQEDEIVYNFSSRELYSLCKKIDNWNGEGTFLGTGMKVVNNDGICRDVMHEDNQALPFDVYKDWRLISQEALVEGNNFKIGGYAFVNKLDKNALKTALIEHGVMLIGLEGNNTGGWFIANKEDPKISPPNPVVWGHAVMLYGYAGDDFWFLNSWGEHWGKQGTAYFNYDEYKNNLFNGWVSTDIPSDILDEYKNKKMFDLVIKNDEQYVVDSYGNAWHVTNLYTLRKAILMGLVGDVSPTPVDVIADTGEEFAIFPSGE